MGQILGRVCCDQLRHNTPDTAHLPPYSPSLSVSCHAPRTLLFVPALQVRVNTISAGPLGSRAAKAIGFIDDMIRYSYANAPIQKELAAKVGCLFVWGCLQGGFPLLCSVVLGLCSEYVCDWVR